MHKFASCWASRINILTIHYKLGQGCITNWGSFALLQIGANVITNWDRLFITKWGRRYYKLGQLLQIRPTVITNWGRLYYKLGQLLQIGAIITNSGIAIHSPVFQSTYILWPSSHCGLYHILSSTFL